MFDCNILQRIVLVIYVLLVPIYKTYNVKDSQYIHVE